MATRGGGLMAARTYHRQVTVQLGHALVAPIEVDEGIAELIVALYSAGFRTVSSCQDFGEMLPAVPQGLAMVAFDGRAQAVEFQRLTGGQLVEQTAADRANAPDDPHNVPASAVTVIFPASVIQATLGKVERLARKACANTFRETNAGLEED